MKNNEILEKKDLYYWLLILLLFIVGTLTIKLVNHADIIQYFSFAGILISIILAVIAIIYTFYAKFTNSNAVSKLDESVARIVTATSIIEHSVMIRDLMNKPKKHKRIIKRRKK